MCPDCGPAPDPAPEFMIDKQSHVDKQAFIEKQAQHDKQAHYDKLHQLDKGAQQVLQAADPVQHPLQATI